MTLVDDLTEKLMAEKTRADRLTAENERLREAVQDVIGARFDTYKAGNGRQVGIVGDDGEKCWIVPFDAMSGLESAVGHDD